MNNIVSLTYSSIVFIKFLLRKGNTLCRPFQTAGLLVRVEASDGAVPGAAGDTVVAGGEAAHGATVSRGLQRGGNLGGEIVWRVGMLHGIFFQKLGEILSKSEKMSRVLIHRFIENLVQRTG